MHPACCAGEPWSWPLPGAPSGCSRGRYRGCPLRGVGLGTFVFVELLLLGAHAALERRPRRYRIVLWHLQSSPGLSARHSLLRGGFNEAGFPHRRDGPRPAASPHGTLQPAKGAFSLNLKETGSLHGAGAHAAAELTPITKPSGPLQMLASRHQPSPCACTSCCSCQYLR